VRSMSLPPAVANGCHAKEQVAVIEQVDFSWFKFPGVEHAAHDVEVMFPLAWVEKRIISLSMLLRKSCREGIHLVSRCGRGAVTFCKIGQLTPAMS
jgi:hypothetical protein